VDIATFIAMVMDLGAKIHGAEMRYLGAMVHGAEVRVHFLKSFQKGRICEILFKKGLKNKKVGITSPYRSSTRCLRG
jgi:ABC-type nitrate/sulfonate/bicarbonate transport system substrate-binding protein